MEVGAEFLEIDTAAKAGSAPPKASTPAPEKKEAPAQVSTKSESSFVDKFNNYICTIGSPINTSSRQS